LGINLRTAEEIGKTCGAAENTIKQTIKLMQRQLSKLLPTDFVSKNPSYANNIPSQATTSKVL
jgi:hypothetical protein